jgi:hypothetical protein
VFILLHFYKKFFNKIPQVRREVKNRKNGAPRIQKMTDSAPQLQKGCPILL